MRHLNSYLVLATLFFSCFVCYIVALIKDLKTGTLHIFLHQPVLGLQFQDLILNWNSDSNASKYNVYYSQSSSNGPWNLVDSTTDTYTDLTAYSAGTFYFVVIAINNNQGLSFNVFNLSEAADNPFNFCVRLIKISILYLFPVVSAGFFVRFSWRGYSSPTRAPH